MSPMDMLFWMLVVLMGGIAWAAEAGVAQRYRRSMASSMLAALGSAIMIMFWVNDTTRIELEKTLSEKKKGGDEGERGSLDKGNGGGGSKKNGGSGNSGPDQQANNKPSGKPGDPTEEKKPEAPEEDTSPVEYTRVPFKDCPMCPDLVIVPKGMTQVGSPRNDPDRNPNEAVAAQYPVPNPFAIGRLEISRGQFAAFAKELKYESATQCDMGRRRGKFNWQNVGFEQDERHPVVCVSWNDVRVYLAWLGEKTKRTYRLPTEVEWEHAARAGTMTPYWLGDSLTRHNANLGRARDGTTGGGAFRANPFGLADYSGNAWEMIADCAPEPDLPAGAAPGPRPCRRWIKGGGWNSPAATGRHAARAMHVDGTALNHVGFRVVRDLDERDDEKILTLEQRKANAQADAEAAVIAQKEEEAAETAKVEALAKKEADLKAAEKAAADKAAADKAAAAKLAQERAKAAAANAAAAASNPKK